MIFAFFNNPSAGAAKYILKDLIDAPTPESISWWPQTIGWQVLLVVFLIYVAVKLGQKMKQWWLNRYRKEAITALNDIALDDLPKALLYLHQIMQITIKYAYPQLNSAQLSGESLIELLDNTGDTKLQAGLGVSWQRALVQPSLIEQFSKAEAINLQQQLILWVQQHTTESTSNFGDEHD